MNEPSQELEEIYPMLLEAIEIGIAEELKRSASARQERLLDYFDKIGF